MSEISLDLIDLKCPLPALRTKKALAALSKGQVLVVTASDPLAGLDIPNVVRETGDELLNQTGENGRMVFTIRKS